MENIYSVMFHHFHNEEHNKSQGSLSADDFEEMLDWISNRYNIIDAKKYLKSLQEKKLKENDICLSFDDALLCQWDIAAPVLRKRKIKSFFFVYSSVFSGAPDYLEIFRYFRTTNFKNIEDFYLHFFEKAKSTDIKNYERAREEYNNIKYLSNFPFYTESDKWFRYLRDQVLGLNSYRRLMFELMRSKKFDENKAIKNLWMKEEHVKALAKEGNVIGLHSFSHPTQMHKLSLNEQKSEYARNKEHLESILGKGTIISMSHPCGNYNEDTLQILKDMGIQIGFRSNLSTKEVNSCLEIPREDHANILKEMRK